jgi:hypothetical protein
MQVRLLIKSSLPFQFLAHQDFEDLITEAQLLTLKPKLLHPRTARRHLQIIVQEDQQRVLSALPSSAKLSITLNY